MLIALQGIGADYPLSSVICSEFAPRKHRARMLASVFLCQPIGQLLGMVVSLVTITASRKWIPRDSEVCMTDECIRALDSSWRWTVGFGSIPAVIALFFRLTIPESPRYLLDIVGAIKSASENTQDFYNGDAFGQSQEQLETGQNSREFLPMEHSEPKSMGQETSSASSYGRRFSDQGEVIAPKVNPSLSDRISPQPLPSPAIAPADDDLGQHQPGAVGRHTDSFPPSIRSAEPTPSDEQQPPKASWQDANDFFIKEKNWIWLFSTSSSWFLLDVRLLHSTGRSKLI
jgi:MFS transporter, PHS family, inorganic phosphate transporter